MSENKERGFSAREAGKLIEQIKQLTIAVTKLTGRIEKLEKTSTFGKGLVAGLFFLSGGIGALVNHFFSAVKL